MNGTLKVCGWVEEIAQGKEPAIPFNLHKGIRVLIDNLGADKTIKFLMDIERLEHE